MPGPEGGQPLNGEERVRPQERLGMNAVERMRAVFEGGPLDRLPRYPFGFFPQTFERWEREGAPPDVVKDGQAGPRFDEYFGFESGGWGSVWVGQAVDLGWCEAPLEPRYEEKVLKVEGRHEIVRDWVGRVKRYPKGQREQVMPTYLKHAVASRKDWENDVRPRLDPETPARWEGYEGKVERNRARRVPAHGQRHRRVYVPSEPHRPGGPAVRVL